MDASEQHSEDSVVNNNNDDEDITNQTSATTRCDVIEPTTVVEDEVEQQKQAPSLDSDNNNNDMNGHSVETSSSISPQTNTDEQEEQQPEQPIPDNNNINNKEEEEVNRDDDVVVVDTPTTNSAQNNSINHEDDQVKETASPEIIQQQSVTESEGQPQTTDVITIIAGPEAEPQQQQQQEEDKEVAQPLLPQLEHNITFEPQPTLQEPMEQQQSQIIMPVVSQTVEERVVEAQQIPNQQQDSRNDATAGSDHTTVVQDDNIENTPQDNDNDNTISDIIAPLISKLPEVDHIFEHFIVVGLSPKSPPRIGTPHKVEVLFSYPPNKQAPPKAHEFCFPNGISPYLIKRTPSCSSLNELLYGQPYLLSSEFFYTFMLTGECPLYGICLTKPELLGTTPNFFHDQPSPLERSLTYIATPRSYCFLSKHPIFNVHFDALMYLLAQDRLITITRELSSAEEFETNDLQQQQQQQQAQQQSTQASASTPSTTTPANESTTDTSSTSTDCNNTNNNDNNNNDQSSRQVKLREQDYKHLVDKKNLLDILEFYRSLTSPSPGQTLSFSFPGEAYKRNYLMPMGKTKNEVYSKTIADWATIGLFMHLSLENILKVLGAVLLEQRVVFVSDNLSLLSSACFAMQSFIHPFVWQGLFVPIIPQALIDYLEAPVPFIAGAQTLKKKSFDGLIVDFAHDKIYYNQCRPPPFLPEFKKLQKNLSSDQQILLNEKNHNPIKNTPTQIEAMNRIYTTIQQYIWWLVKKIENSFLVTEEIAADSLKIEQLKNKFLATVSSHNKDFVSMLLDTQHFSHFLHSSLVQQPTATTTTTTTTTTTS
ncbi:hypothetical protein SAMD00019534_047510 [Acytostelium subglobosum LB1]|uniref:hypothetical protein n=1 Tax=Acytostelium subglobosum LB1 TaxID=1410327 RepID=UPI000644AAE3|nr:hypothetical protein SAMD00019534_047510 [Acytostelium subglobosum LB1]GAM21576.1 hypothetical protein SAMD00019534_047510 [Acytostelium subglobosum LB1]|eukprot:XP_012755695.1 hypothetical protein SAMD00019534_047510 [Acytostelium subglobosum LB1]